MWLYGSGFPKSHNIGLAIDEINGVESKVVGEMNAPSLHDVGLKQKALGNGNILTFGQIENAERLQYQIKQANNKWNGWGTCLKPAYEPIIVARKPVEGSVTQNVIKHGVGGINIDECRVPTSDYYHCNAKKTPCAVEYQRKNKSMFCDKEESEMNPNGRFPANVITDGSEEVTMGMPNSKGTDNIRHNNNAVTQQNRIAQGKQICGGFKNNETSGYTDEGSVCRYFYSAKASKKDRDEGLDMFESITVNDGRKTEIDNAFQRGETLRKNIHPTVKPCELMQYLIRLVTPKGETILDPFNGSGSTGKAVAFENRERKADYKYIGIELSKDYCDITKARIDYAINKYEYDFKKELEKQKEKGQLSLFDFIKG